MSSQPLTETPLEVGKYVRTPSGAIVKLLELYAMSDGAVEALVAGDEAAVQALLSACRRGPPLARVDDITEEFAEPPGEPGFRRR